MDTAQITEMADMLQTMRTGLHVAMNDEQSRRRYGMLGMMLSLVSASAQAAKQVADQWGESHKNEAKEP